MGKREETQQRQISQNGAFSLVGSADLFNGGFTSSPNGEIDLSGKELERL